MDDEFMVSDSLKQETCWLHIWVNIKNQKALDDTRREEVDQGLYRYPKLGKLDDL